MKKKYKFFTIILAAFLIFPAYAAPISDSAELADEAVQLCPHNTLYEFDEKNKTVTGVYEGNRVEALLADIAFVGDTAVIIHNGEEATEGEIQIGMSVKIYHDDLLYGQYTIEQLREPFPEIPAQSSPADDQIQANSPMRAAANAYGFILPIDGMNLIGHISQGFGSDYGGPNYKYHNHRGIDISWGDSINGTPIRAMADGKVTGYLNWNKSMGYDGNNSWGSYIKINHQNGYTILYAHMKDAPSVKLDQWVSQGQIIGYVGNTGEVDPLPTDAQPKRNSHLHLEVEVNGVLQNPITYLTGAPTYSGAHTCNYEYVWYEGSHPHERYEQCTTCGDLRSMGTYAATYEYTYYLTGHPHRQYGMCNICNVEKPTGENKTCNQVAIYPDGDHPHRRYRVYACGATEWLDSYGECNQVAIYPSGEHPHRRYRKYACGAAEWLDSYGECNQVAIYPSGEHPHRRYRVYACGATEWLDSYGECNQVAIYPSGEHPHRRYRKYACGATEWLDSYGECNQVAIYPDGDHPHRRYRKYACGATEWLDSYGECTCE